MHLTFISQPLNNLPQAPFAYAPLLRYAVCVIVGVACGWWCREWVSSSYWLIAALVVAAVGVATIVREGRRAKGGGVNHSALSEANGWLVYLLAFGLVAVAAFRSSSVTEQIQTEWPTQTAGWRATILSVQKVYEGKAVSVYAELTGCTDGPSAPSPPQSSAGNEDATSQVTKETSSSFSKNAPSKDSNNTPSASSKQKSEKGIATASQSNNTPSASSKQKSEKGIATASQSNNTPSASSKQKSNPSPQHYAGKRVKLYVAGATAEQLQPGATLLFRAQMVNQSGRKNPGDFDEGRYLLVQGMSGTAYVSPNKWTLSATPDAPRLSQRLLLLRHQLVQRLSHYLQGEQLAILSALTLGDKSQLDASIRRPFQETGTSHVLALSGLHLGILFAMLQFFLVRPLRRPSFRAAAQVLILLVLWLFVALAGSPLSLQRAAWMLTIVQVGSFFTRGYQGTLNNLALAALLILFFSPLSLFDVGFQLSFAAVLSIALMNRYVWALHPFPSIEDTPDVKHLLLNADQLSLRQRWIVFLYQTKKSAYAFFTHTVVPFFTISLSAQIGTAPFVLYYFHNLPLLGLVGNVLVIPIAYLLLGGSLLFFLLPFDALSSLLARGLSFLLTCLTHGLNVLAECPGASFTLYPHPLTLLSLTLLLYPLWAFFHQAKSRRRRCLLQMGALLLVASVSELYAHRPQRMQPQLIVYHLPRAYALHFVRSADESYWLPSADSVAAMPAWQRIEQNFWQPNGMSVPQLITSSHFRTASLQREGCCFAFRGQRILWLQRTYSEGALRRLPARSVYLIDRGCATPPAQICTLLRPRQVVLLPTLSARSRAQWTEICRARAIPCHDMRRDGAYRFYLPRSR